MRESKVRAGSRAGPKLYSGVAAGLLALLAAAGGARAQSETAPEPGEGSLLERIELSGEVALVSDYRFRGVSLSEKDPAIQGALGLSLEGAFLGAWASSIDNFNGAETELDVTAGYGFELGGLAIEAGGIAFLFPGGEDTDYLEAYTAVSGSLAALDWTLGVNYTPNQSNIGSEDNIYVSGGIGYGLPGLPVSLDAGIGYEDGAFGHDKVDWRTGFTYSGLPMDISVHYIDARDDVTAISGTAVVTLSKAF